MGWSITLRAHPSGQGGGKSQAGGLCHRSPPKKEPSGFPAKNNRNKIILCAPRERFRRRAKGRSKLRGCCLFLQGALDPTRARILPSLQFYPQVPTSPGPTQHPGRPGGCAGDSPCGTWTGTATAHPQQGTEPAAPAAHAQLDLRHPIPAKSYGCPETHRRGGESRPVELFAANSAAAQRYRCTAVAVRIWDFLQVTLPVLHGATCGEAAGERNGLAEPSTDGNELEEARVALDAGWYEKGDAHGAGCPFPELAGAGAVMATAEQLPGLRRDCWSPHEPASSVSSPLTPQKMSDTLP